MIDIKNKKLRSIFGQIALSKASVKAKYTLPIEEYKYKNINWDEIIEYKLNKMLIDKISQNTSKTTKKIIKDTIEFNKDILVFDSEYFKYIIETVIQSLSYEKIKEIKEIKEETKK